MKIYKNQNKDNAKQNGFQANFAFASDEIMSSKGLDIMKVVGQDILLYEVTQYNKETDTCDIQVMNEKEYNNYLSCA